jgi:cell fate regulator YaaT (PSP1 superfamily)
MCCLKYEHPLYQSFAETAPAVGTRVSSPDGSGKVVGHSVPRDEVVIRLDADGTRSRCPRADVCPSRKAYESRHQTGR